MEQQLLGIDVGTTGLKAAVIEPRGKLLGEATAHYEIARPQPGWTEQRPELWWEACIEALSTLRQQGALRDGAVAGIGLTGQMHGSVFLTEAGEVVRPAIMWNDQRTAAECGLIEERIGTARLIELTGNRALTGFTAPKVLWLRRHEADSFRRTRRLLL
ncbi:MAG TPA: FGGY family carbohydrate kinase, partial [Dehalococcoidia bacterium]|nr:FGGY family carbohydrate kinase [Dehalococcoidia bacterium]